jgi:hypothetical protein
MVEAGDERPRKGRRKLRAEKEQFRRVVRSTVK